MKLQGLGEPLLNDALFDMEIFSKKTLEIFGIVKIILNLGEK